MYARCENCGAEIEPREDSMFLWRCPSCGDLDPSCGMRCETCGTLEEYWGGDALMCPRCFFADDDDEDQ
jgi:predicted RNA-binding Zn-ribbon protein involved in translation (DUF1610 family)